MIFENELAQFGMAGLFIIYLIYDSQVWKRAIITAINKNTEAIDDLKENLKHGRK